MREKAQLNWVGDFCFSVQLSNKQFSLQPRDTSPVRGEVELKRRDNRENVKRVERVRMGDGEGGERGETGSTGQRKSANYCIATLKEQIAM